MSRDQSLGVDSMRFAIKHFGWSVALLLAAAPSSAQGKMYFASGTELLRSDLDGSNVEVVTTVPGTTLQGLLVEPVGRKLYWSGRFDGVLQRSNLDGSDEELVTFGFAPIRASIAVDSAAGKIYWTDVQARKIMRANVDGTGATEDLLTFGLHAPQGIAIYFAN